MNTRLISTPRQDLSAAGQLPVSYYEWEYRARQILPNGPFGYIAGGAGSEDTMRANEDAFLLWRIQPRLLNDVSNRNLSITLFGQTFPVPFLLAPIGLQEIINPEADFGSARAAASLGVPYVLSTPASRSIESVAAVMGDSPRWFQLYWGSDLDVAGSMVQRAEKAGYTAIVVTVDLPARGWRGRDQRNQYFPARAGVGTANFMSDPVFRSKLKQSPEQNFDAAVDLFLSIYFNPALTWNDLPILRKYTKLPILLKGILAPEDAELALHYGMDGIIVSNHGGRQLDGEIAALAALPKICEVVKRRIPVLMDSGIRGGDDVIKAIALGASAVLLGRPYIYGLAVAGEQGVRTVLTNLISEIDLSLANSGKKSISEINQSLLVKAK